jgi:hypothetical protein
MAYLPPAQRAFDVLAPITIYRQIGRRPSQIFVDEAMQVAAPGTAARHRLNDRVYWRTTARPGDQIQDRPGGTLLVTASGDCHPILLAEPRPIEAASAFTHAEQAIQADIEAAQRLVAAGQLVETAPRRPKGSPTLPADGLLAADHPLIIDALPKGFVLERDEPLKRGRPWRQRERTVR